ncbi:MAG: AAA family ATPase [Candidatus Woesearchaeota archaeon]
MLTYTNPVYTDFKYAESAERRELTDILGCLVKQFNGVMPEVSMRRQMIYDHWNKKYRREEPRLAVSWDIGAMNEQLYRRLERIFNESVLDDTGVHSKDYYRIKGKAPAKFVGFDGCQTGKIRGFPVYPDNIPRFDCSAYSETKQILWVAREYPTLKDAKQNMKGRGKNYWFYSDGRFVVNLRLESCKEIEFIDTALRVSVALNGSYDSFDRAKALYLAQKQLVRRDTKSESQDDILGLDELIEDIKFRQFFATLYPEEARRLGVTDESVLLVGVPGTGKSSIASSLLWDPQLEEVVFIPLDVTELLQAGYSSNKIMDSFFGGIRDMHRRYGFRPMLWCDDLEAAFLEDRSRGSREVAVTQSTLLNQLQGVTKDYGVRISGSSNYPERIDPRFLEFGRISYMYHVPIPTDTNILARILSKHISKREQVILNNDCIDLSDDFTYSNVDIHEIVAECIGFTPRLLVKLVNEAGMQAAKRIYKTFSGTRKYPLVVTGDDYKKAIKIVKSTTDLDHLKRRDEEISAFVVKKGGKRVGFR